ncbi:MAG: IS701 family transposase, partial [Thioploca sp.]|nr:IS701 family transposase [Thioploca sp.]
DRWLRVKPLVRPIESDDGVLILDDSIMEQPSTEESSLICWHADPAKDRMVKDINFISALYHHQEGSLPVGIHLVMKPDDETAPKTGKRKRQALFTQNHYGRSLLSPAVQNPLRFR